MSIVLNTLCGPAFPPPRPRRSAPLTRDQIQATRDDVWLRWTESGVLDSEGRPRPVSLREIARISGKPLRTVREGIARARRIREAVRHATDNDL